MRGQPQQPIQQGLRNASDALAAILERAKGKTAEFYTYYFKFQPRELTKAEVATLAYQNLQLRANIISFTPVPLKIQGRSMFYHVVVFDSGGVLDHNGFQFGFENETVHVSVVNNWNCHFVQSNAADTAAATLLNSLKILDPVSVQKLMPSVKLFCEEGRIALDERNAEEFAFLEIAKELGVDQFIKWGIEWIGGALLKEFLNLTEADQARQVDIFLSAAVSCTMSVRNISYAIQMWISDEKYFQNSVKRWFNPVQQALNSIVRASAALIRSLESYQSNNDPEQLAGAWDCLKRLSQLVQDLLNKIPPIQQLILDYSKLVEKLEEEQRKKAKAAFLKACLTLGISLAENLPTILENGWDALSALDQAEFLVHMVTGTLSAVEAGVSAAAAANFNSHFAQARAHMQFYDKLYEQLDIYNGHLKNALAGEARFLPLLLEDFNESHGELLKLQAQAKTLMQ